MEFQNGERVAVLTPWGNVGAYAIVVEDSGDPKIEIRWEENGEETKTPRSGVRKTNPDQPTCEAPRGPWYGCPVVGRHVHTED